MAKLKVQAQYLQAGDVVGSGEVIKGVVIGINTPRGKILVMTDKRTATWGKYTMIGVERDNK